MINRANDNSREKNELFQTIGAISFALDDLRLYLDTHPSDERALALYSEYQKQRHALVVDYTNKFGSIDSYYVNTENGWEWNDSPMPWGREAN